MADEDEIVNEAENSASDDNESSETENPKAAIAPKKKMLFILIGLAVLLLGGAGVYFSGILTATPSEEVVSEETEASDEEPKEEKEVKTNPDGTPVVTDPAKDIYFDVPDILVNLNTDGKKQVYLKVLITLALPDAETSTKVENNMPRILDGFQIYLRELTVDEIQGSAGMFRLKEELVERINRIIAPSRINDVLFKEMLIQ